MRSERIRECSARHMQAWKQLNVQDKHYLRGESPDGWPDFALGLRDDVGQSFVSLFSVTQSP